MTLLTVDAKLMPILPLMLRPESKTALTVAFGMGSAFRSALIAGLKTDAVELVPSVPLMFGYFYPDASSVLANPNGRLIVTDGRNHMELTDQTYDIIVTDRRRRSRARARPSSRRSSTTRPAKPG
jgi:spermidine synthase